MLSKSLQNHIFCALLIVALLTAVESQKKCPLYCQSCNDGGRCEVCQSLFNLNEKGLCQINNYIEACQIYSAQISQNRNACVQCSAGFTLMKNKCHKIIKNCEQLNQFSDCQKCANGYDLVDRECMSTDIKNCGLGKFPYKNVCRKYPISNCRVKKNQICQTCNQGFILHNGVCISKLSCAIAPLATRSQTCKGIVINSTCYNCKPDHCISSTNGLHCDICESYYVVVGGMCYKPVKYDDVNCNLMDLQIEMCTGCNQNYMLDRNSYCVKNFMVTNCVGNGSRFFDYFNGKCLYRDRFCQSINYNTYECIYCLQGYTLRAGKCEKIDRCLRKSVNQQCIECLPQFFLHPSKKTCEQLPRSCITFSIELNQCTYCRKPNQLTTLTANNQTICAIVQKPCLQYNKHATCIQCADGYTISNRKCVLKAQYCTTPHPIDLSLCLVCQQGYILQDNKCYKEIANCVKYNQTDSLCARCVSITVIHNNNSNSNNNSYMLVKGKCIIADKYCIQIDEDGMCIRCMQGLLPYGSRCVYYQPFCAGYSHQGVCNKAYNKYFTINDNITNANKQQYRLFIMSSSQIKSYKPSQLRKSTTSSLYKGYYDENGIIISYPTLSLTSNSIKSYNLSMSILQCYDQYTLYNNLCIPNKNYDKNCYQYSSITLQCILCRKGYDINSIYKCIQTNLNTCQQKQKYNNQCKVCNHQYVLYNGMCINKNIEMNNDKYHKFIKQFGIIWAILPNCAVQIQLNKCELCQPSYLLKQGKCIKYQVNCQLYNKYGDCKECKNGYSLSGANCIPNNCVYNNNNNSIGCVACQNGYQYQNGRCYPSRQPNCIMYNGMQCTLCQYLYHMASTNTTNININNNNNNISNGNKRCEPVINNCQVMNSSTNRCQVCAQKYILYRESCILQIANCVQYTFSGLCSKCSEQPTHKYQLSANGSCIKIPARCAKLNQLSICQQCDMGYTMINSQCVIYRQNCNNYDATTGRCYKCQEGGYWLKNGYCFFVIPYCLSTNTVQKVCEKCIDNYAIAKDGFCVLYDQHCAVHRYGDCMQCKQMYHLHNYKCTPNPTNCIVYSYSNSKCQLCTSDSVLIPISHTCTLKSILTNGCSIFNATSITCTQCLQQYTLKQDGLCYAVTCLTYNQYRNCQLCPSHYKMQKYSNICIPQFCNKYSAKNIAKCIQYQQQYEGGYIVHTSGRIQIQYCKQYNKSNNKCVQCENNRQIKQYNNNKYSICVSYHCSKNNGNVCVQCKQNYTLINNMCIAKYCKQYNNKSVCNKCILPFQLNQHNLCVLYGGCKQYSLQLNSCVKCHHFHALTYTQQSQQYKCIVSNCLQYNKYNNSLCVKCQIGYERRSDGICVISQCVAYAYTYHILSNTNTKDNNKINKIISNKYSLQISANKQQCKQCKQGYQPFQGNICRVSNCAKYDTNKIQCVQCMGRYKLVNGVCAARNCVQYKNSNNISCSKCEQQYDNQNGGCYHKNCLYANELYCASCEDGWYKDKNGHCVVQDCKQYDKQSKQCVRCGVGKRLANGICVNDHCYDREQESGDCLQCDSGFTVSENGKFCIAQFCKKWDIDNGECIACAHGFVFDNGRCESELCTKFIQQYDVAYIQQCTQCKQGYTPYKQYCIINNCNSQHFDPLTSTCTLCQSGFQYINNMCKLANCLQYLNKQFTQCKQCKQGYKYVHGLCIEASCRKYGNYRCEECQEQYAELNGKCVKHVPIKDQDQFQYIYKYKDVPVFGESHLPAMNSINMDQFNKKFNSKFNSKPNNNNNNKDNDDNDNTYSNEQQKWATKQHSLNNNMPQISEQDWNIYKIDTGQDTATKNEEVVNHLQHCLYQDSISQICIICDTEYYITEEGTCLPLPPFCRFTNSKGLCLSCFHGYTVVDDVCVKDSQNNANKNDKNIKNSDINAFQAADQSTDNIRKHAN